ncbi:hypothetical protein HF086_015514 [Spodoptera exigua]|uniref:Uncharacterized protein n=1 Tax=Spodoptera exigua TaxID=7107 RepID=A0A922MWU4_SPOEX|nr:hypothetical protein HF086_015514 [Spodoptera exigua]
MLHQLYFRHVLVNPKERKVVVVESLLTPTLFRETLAKVLFIHYEQLAKYMPLNIVRLAHVGSGALVRGSTRAAVAAAGLARRARRAGQDAGRAQRRPATPRRPGHRGHQSEDVFRDEPGPRPGVGVGQPAEGGARRALRARDGAGARARAGGRALVPARPRAELAARRSTAVRGGQPARLPARAGGRHPADGRRRGALPGCARALAAELRQLVTQPPYCDTLHVREFKFHDAPSAANACAWLGGAVLGAGEAGAARAMPRDQFARAPRLRDWVCLLDNTPPGHPHRDHLDI